MRYAVPITEQSLDLIATNNGGLQPEVVRTPEGDEGSFFLLPENPNESADILTRDQFFDNYMFIGGGRPNEFRPVSYIGERDRTATTLVIHKATVDISEAMFLDCVEVHVPSDALIVDIQRDGRFPGTVGIWYQRIAPDMAGSASWDSIVWGVRVIADGAEFPSSARHLMTVVVEGRAWHLLDLYDNMAWAPYYGS